VICEKAFKRRKKGGTLMTYSVLIVEDDKMVLSINKRYVEKIPGFKVVDTALTMKDALKLTNKYLYDLLLIDIHLENESGLDLIKMLRKKEYPADFIMITAINEQEAIELSTQYGAVDYILKPFQFSRFQKSLLRFKQQKELLAPSKQINQSDIDKFYWPDKGATTNSNSDLEKGLTEETLDLIISSIEEFDEPFTINDLTEKISLSHVSVRKYVHYLEDQGYLTAKQKYGTVGRPTLHYKKT